MIGRLILSLAALAIAMPAAAKPDGSPRQRISINSDWRFHKGDPAGMTVRLDYDVRPAVDESGDGKAADTRPEDAQRLDSAGLSVLKPWILPGGNAFIRDPAKRYVRPAGDPGGDLPFVQFGFDDSGWQGVTLPHDWAITGPWLEAGPYGGMGRLPSWGIGWYRKKLDIPASDAGKSIFLDVDGAMSYATVWLNGHLVGGWPYGYTSWRVDLTRYIVPGGANQLAIRLDNPPASSRWYPGGGIYRNVWLTKTGRVHVGQWGTHVTTPEVSAAAAKIDVSVSVDNDSATAAPVEVSSKIYALTADGERTGPVVAQTATVRAIVPPGGAAAVNTTATLANPRLWGPPPQQKPNRYVAVTSVTRAGKLIDRYETKFGIRTIRFDPDKGLIVNGERIPLRGVNNHSDLGALGAAFNTRAAQRQLEILKDMGANALRMSHNPPAPELLDLCDRMGILVIDEVFDSWLKKKTPLDFHLVFADWHEQDLRSMLRRDRNSPSIIVWSIGNEVGEQYSGEEGAAIARELVGIVRQEDSSR
ncbi:MAG: glycoside hydrolase family 2 TIM barrel-domain containing protein, partial [Sphingomonas sp.]